MEHTGVLRRRAAGTPDPHPHLATQNLRAFKRLHCIREKIRLMTNSLNASPAPDPARRRRTHCRASSSARAWSPTGRPGTRDAARTRSRGSRASRIHRGALSTDTCAPSAHLSARARARGRARGARGDLGADFVVGAVVHALDLLQLRTKA
jgi:hypothetical protein